MKCGFTGSRTPPSASQAAELERELVELGVTELHHGDCIGGDALAHFTARKLGGIRIVIHPPTNPRFRAFCQGDESWPEAEYMVRNKSIVRATNWLIALPNGPEVLHSGTWSTVRFARKVCLPDSVFMP